MGYGYINMIDVDAVIVFYDSVGEWIEWIEWI